MALPLSEPPSLRPVNAVARAGEFCLSDLDRRALLVDVELLRSFGISNQAIIKQYNKSLTGIK